MAKPALDFKQVSYKYPGVDEWTLKNINLEIPRNSFYIIACSVVGGILGYISYTIYKKLENSLVVKRIQGG